MTELDADWRMIDGVATAWFGAPSLSAGVALADRIVDLPGIAMDLRSGGVRVRVDHTEHTAAVTAAARQIGLDADPSGLQQLSVDVETGDPAAVHRFWQPVLGYATCDDGLVDPLRRDPAVRIHSSSKARPLRNRIHLDVVRPAAAVAALGLGDGTGPYGVCHADADGNEVDLVPGDALGDGATDWQAVFGAVACYRTTSPAQQRSVAAAAASAADEAGFPLLIDLRPGLVILDSGKDRWEADAHGLDLDFTELASTIQTAARDLGATADPGSSRFVQLFLDAADVAVARAFWIAALGFSPDARDGVTDIHDPRWLNPVLVFQPLDASDAERRRQRNRILLRLTVPADAAAARVATIVAAGGRLLDEAEGQWRIADPDGNELLVVGA